MAGNRSVEVPNQARMHRPKRPTIATMLKTRHMHPMHETHIARKKLAGSLRSMDEPCGFSGSPGPSRM